PERDIMHLRNKPVAGALLVLLLVTTLSLGQGQPNQASAQDQGTQQIQPTPLPPDVDPRDPAVPVWVPRPAVAPAAANNTKPATNANVPPKQPGKVNEQPITEAPVVGEVTKDASGGFIYKSIVNEVTLSATVLDTKRHLVTNLDRTNFVVYEDG